MSTGLRMKKKRAEKVLEEKYYKTLDLINATRKGNKGDKNKTSVHIKKENIEFDDEDAFDEKKLKGANAQFEISDGARKNMVVNINKL